MNQSTKKVGISLKADQMALLSKTTTAGSGSSKNVGTLDHNNFVGTLSPKKEKISVKIKKSTKPPPIRAFNGEIVDIRKGPPSGAIYDFDTELQTTSSPFDVLKMSVEELLQQPDFLRIDQSKLPLEIFDNLEYEAMDKPPSHWISSECHGYAPYYLSGKWLWRKVEILGYSEENGKYLIRFSEGSEPKYVHRMNLRMSLESESLFEKRREVAERGRNEAKQIMRFDHFVKMQSNELIRAIRRTSLRKIHERIIDGLPATCPFPDQGTNLGNLFKSSTNELIHWYSTTMKKIVVVCKMQGVQRDESMVVRYTVLNLPPLPKAAPVPLIGKVPCPLYPFLDRKMRLGHLHLSAQYEVLTLHKWLYDKWDSSFRNFKFVDCDLSTLTLPCNLEEFKGVQHDRSELAAKFLRVDFRHGFMDQFSDYCQDIFDFFQSNMTVFKSGSLYKLFRGLDLRLAYFLRSMLQDSLEQWKNFVGNYTTVIPALEGELPAFVLSNAPRSTELNFPIDARVPLFRAELKLLENNVVLEPSLDDFLAVFLAAIDRIVVNIKSVTSIDRDIMSLLQLDAKILLNIASGDRFYADLDSLVKNTKATITASLQKAFKRPQEFIASFQEFCWLLDEDAEDYVDKFARREIPLTIEEYNHELTRIDTAIKTVQNLSFSSEDFGFVRIQSSSVKQILSDKALELRNGLLNLIKLQGRHENVDIVAEYQGILDRIAVKPANEQQLADLRDFIISSRDTVERLKGRVAACRLKLSILNRYLMPLGAEDTALSWSTLEYPSTVDHSGKEVEITLDADKVRMMDRLELQKGQFEQLMETLLADVKAATLVSDYEDKEKVAEKINNLADRIEDAKRTGDDFNMREKVFGFAPTDYSILGTFSEKLAPFYKLWNMISDFSHSKVDWLTGDFKALDGSQVEGDVTEWWKSSYKLAKSLEEEFPGAAGCANMLRTETTEFRKNLPVIQALASKALKKRHWDELGELLGQFVNPDEELTLQVLLDLDAVSKIEGIMEITSAAEKQYNLERNLNAMKAEWEAMEFEVKPYKETGTFIVGGIDDIMTLLDDHIVKTQTMRGSPYIKPIEKEAKEWEYRLKYAQSLLDAWITCQRTWMYLEPIFGSDDIMRQLPQEGRRFQSVDQLWKKTLGETSVDPNFMSQASPDKRLEEKFKKANEKLDEITKGLNDYLETKRLYFPRFFFLSNDELLEILSQTKEPRAVQPHLGKCFEGINRVHFEADAKISKIISAEGEVIDLDRCIDPETSANKGNVEKWLLDLESIQWDSVRTKTVGSLEEYPKLDRKKWILNWPAQVVIGVSCVYWTSEVTTALQSGAAALKEASVKLDNQLKDIVVLVRGKLSGLQRKTLGALTTIDVHNRDVVSKMVELGTHDPMDFEWMSQLRYYWEDAWKDGQATKKGNKTLVARIVNARCLYGYEYLVKMLIYLKLFDVCSNSIFF
jgi:dynein heavy chain, axonemal